MEKLFNQISLDSERSNVTQMWQLFIDYVYPIITDYDFLSDCFSRYEQQSQAMLDVGYVSLLTLSFISKIKLCVFTETCHFVIFY